MKKYLVYLAFSLFFFFLTIPAFAAQNPLEKPNNKFGIHILFPSEIRLAASLVNSNGGDWGYVTIPIQSGDKNMAKWQSFFDDCKQYHVIPILRLATEGDYFNTTVWRKPNYLDIVDFANFLNSLNWPTKNRYIIVFNEVNRGDEWGGTPNPSEYADLLNFAVTIFKSRNDDFFIISAGLDNAAANTKIAMNEYSYLRAMNQEVPGIFSQVDGIGSHSYPNPAFLQPPTLVSNEAITSFRFEQNLIAQTTKKDLPIFITETGWTRNGLSDSTIASYFVQAFTSVWNDNHIAAVTPFLLEAGDQFAQFSVLTSTGGDTLVSKAIKGLPKTKGQPSIAEVLSAHVLAGIQHTPVVNFTKQESQAKDKLPDATFRSGLKQLAKYLLHL